MSAPRFAFVATTGARGTTAGAVIARVPPGLGEFGRVELFATEAYRSTCTGSGVLGDGGINCIVETRDSGGSARGFVSFSEVAVATTGSTGAGTKSAAAGIASLETTTVLVDTG